MLGRARGRVIAPGQNAPGFEITRAWTKSRISETSTSLISRRDRHVVRRVPLLLILVLSGLAPLPLADEGSGGYRAASHRGADEDAVLGMLVGSCDGATRAPRHSTESDPVAVRCRRPRGALAPALQPGPARLARDVHRARHRVQL